jgi:hypothetical protein
LPMSYFDKDKMGSTRPSVNITINGIGDTTTIIDDISDAEDI